MDNTVMTVQMRNTDKAIGVLKRFEAARIKREQFLSIWQEVADLVLPARGGFYNLDSSGSIVTFDTHPEKYDDTATNALFFHIRLTRLLNGSGFL